jgi:HK97 family phage major capsid protein
VANSSTLRTYFGLAETSKLVIEPVTRESLAIGLTTLVTTVNGSYRIPMVTEDPTASWTAEGAEIPLSEAVGDETLIVPKKIAVLSKISNELANDTSPAAQGIIGDGIARDIARRIDSAFFGAAPASDTVQPGGLEFLGDAVTTIAADPTAGLDAYVDAMAAASDLGVTLGAFVVDSATGVALAKMKTGSASNQPLLSITATGSTVPSIHGVPYLVSRDALPGTVWGIPTGRIFTVLREDVTVDIDTSVFFTSDQTAIRGVARIGFGFVQPQAVIKIKATA